MSELEAILAALTKNYVDRGYVTTRVCLPAQDLQTGVLEIRAIEGTIERFELQQTGRPDSSTWVRGAFPAKPGDKPGESVVVVRSQASFPVALYAAFRSTAMIKAGGAKWTGSPRWKRSSLSSRQDRSRAPLAD